MSWLGLVAGSMAGKADRLGSRSVAYLKRQQAWSDVEVLIDRIADGALFLAPWLFDQEIFVSQALLVGFDDVQLADCRPGRQVAPIGPKIPFDALATTDLEARVNEPLALLFTDEAVLERRLDLPYAAAADIAAMVRRDLATSSPFGEDPLATIHGVVEYGARSIAVEACAVDPERLRLALDCLQRAGMTPVAVGRLGAGDERASWLAHPPFLPPRRPRLSPPIGASVRRFGLALGLVCAVLSSELAWSAFAIAWRTDRIEAAERALRGKIVEEGDQEILRDYERRGGATVSSLNELARHLPDGAWLEEFRFTKKGIEAAIAASSPPDALRQLGSAQGFGEVALASAITREQATPVSHFRIAFPARDAPIEAPVSELRR